MIIGHAAYLTCVCSGHMEAGIDLQACGTWLFALFPSTGTACVCVLSFQTRLLCGTRFSRVLQNLHRVSRRDPSVHQVTPSHGCLSPLHWRRTVVHQNKSQVRAQCPVWKTLIWHSQDLLQPRYLTISTVCPLWQGKATSSLWIICIIRKNLLISVRNKFNSSTHFYIKHIIT